MKLNNFIFFDLETTGTDPSSDRICSLKMVLFDDKEVRTDKYLIVNPTIQIPIEATEVHGITNEMVKDKPTFKQYSKAIYESIKGKTLVGFNSNSFDVPLLFTEFDRSGVEIDIFEPNIDFIDVRNLHVYHNKTDLSSLYKLYLKKDLKGAHDANNDVEATIEIFNKIVSKYKIKPEELTLKSNFDEERDTDVFRKIKRLGEKLTFVFTFGKNKNKDVTSDPTYIEWIVRNNFPQTLKNFLTKLINKNNGK